jgi:hypothetical protein
VHGGNRRDALSHSSIDREQQVRRVATARAVRW